MGFFILEDGLGMNDTEDTLRDTLAAAVVSLGYEFVGYTLHRQGRGSVLCIYIDSDNGITLDDCSKVSRQVSAMLDVEELIRGQYTLEVSSPGIDRPLFELKHYQKYIGCQVKIKLYAAINQRRQYKGILQRVEGENIHILVDNSIKEVVLPFSSIEKANLIKDVRI